MLGKILEHFPGVYIELKAISVSSAWKYATFRKKNVYF